MAADAMQWWGALTQQFQHIAQQTMSEAARHMPQAMEQMMASANPAAPAKPARRKSAAAPKAAPARKTAAKKAAPRKTAAKPAPGTASPLAGNWPLPPSTKRSGR